MKKLLLSTAILGAATMAAVAQDQPIFRDAPEAMEVRGSDFIGMRLYASEAAVEGEEFEGIQEGWEDIGEVNDIVLNQDGQALAVLIDIGGFLGIGERTVAVSMDAIQFVSDSATAEEAGDFFLVINANREALEGAPEYRAVAAEGMDAEQAAAETEQVVEEGGEQVAEATEGAVTTVVTTTENAGEEVAEAVDETGEAVDEAGEEVAEATEGAATTVVTTTENAGEEVAEGVENAVEETGEEVADAGAEVADEAADAGEEIAEEVDQVDMTDTEEDQAEVVDEAADASEEAAEESAHASEEAADEAADASEGAAEESAEASEEAAEDAEDMAEESATEVREPVVREGFAVAGAEDLTAERLQGAAVYDVNDERVGEVGEILLSADGSQVAQLVVDVGGFLGIGEKPVALEMGSLDILRQDGGEEIRVYVSQTEEELEQMESYDPQ